MPNERATGGATGGAWRDAGLFRFTGAIRPRTTVPRFDLRHWLRRQLAREADARTAFFLLPLGMMIGIALVYHTGWRPPLSAGLACAALLGVVALRWDARLAPMAAGAAFACLGAAFAVFEIDRTDTIVFSGEATVRIEGRVLWRDHDERGRYRYLVAIERTQRPTLSRAPQRAEILVSSGHEPLALGQGYRGLVRLRPPSGPALPGGYDFVFGAFFEGLGAHGFALGPPDPPGDGEAAVSLSIAETLTALRLTISDRIRTVVAGPEGAVASAIITGERSGIPDDVEEWLRVTGLSHVLSISGVHMALAAGFAMVLVRGLCAMLPVVALNLSTKKIAAWAALGVSAAYLALSGADVAATRSFIMIAIMLIAVIFDRTALTLRNVAIAALIVLAITPHALFTASFQMSFAATAAIIALYGAFARRFQAGEADERRRGLLRSAAFWLIGIAVSSTIAGLATAPYAAFHFQRVAPFGLAANVLALPIFSFWIMPLALLAMLAMPIGLDAPFLWLLGKGLTAVFRMAEALAAYMPDNPTGLVAVAGLATMTVAILIACFLSSGLRFVSVPIAALGLFLTVDRSGPPEVLVFEDGREVALIDDAGRLSTLKARPNRFVLSQWQRAFPAAGSAVGRSVFTCETIEGDCDPKAPVSEGKSGSGLGGGKAPKPRRYQFCRASTRSGMRVAWTDDYRLLGRACDEADLAIVARAVRTRECRSGAMLLTLKTLRESGSVTASASGDRRPNLRVSIRRPREEWNLHRLAPWPERWRTGQDTAAASSAIPAGGN